MCISFEVSQTQYLAITKFPHFFCNCPLFSPSNFNCWGNFVPFLIKSFPASLPGVRESICAIFGSWRLFNIILKFLLAGYFLAPIMNPRWDTLIPSFLGMICQWIGGDFIFIWSALFYDTSLGNKNLKTYGQA